MHANSNVFQLRLCRGSRALEDEADTLEKSLLGRLTVQQDAGEPESLVAARGDRAAAG